MDFLNQVEDMVMEETEEVTPETLDNLNGNMAGAAFARRHIVDKINLFLEEYRRNGYTENFVSGFIDGVNDVTGGRISLVIDECPEGEAADMDS